jgi:hypothetical protein
MADRDTTIHMALLVFGAASLVAVIAYPANPEPWFSIVSPQDGQEISNGDTLILAPANFRVLDPSNTNAPNEGHFHVYIDSNETTYLQLYDTVAVLEGLTLGNHTIRVAMQNNDHTPLGIEQSVSVNVVPEPPLPEESSA